MEVSAISRAEKSEEEVLLSLIKDASPDVLDTIFGSTGSTSSQITSGDKGQSERSLLSFLVELCRPGPMRDSFEDLAILRDSTQIMSPGRNGKAQNAMRRFMEKEDRGRLAFQVHKNRFPSQIWHCCRKLCFATVATDPSQFKLMEQLVIIHNHAEKYHSEREKLPQMIEKRKRGVGNSTVVFASRTREERVASSGMEEGTKRQLHLRRFAKFVSEVLPFLYGKEDAPHGTKRPDAKFCTQAICSLLGTSRNFLYYRKPIEDPTQASEEELASIVDSEGLRLRQHRRMGHRINCPEIASLQEFECGCDTPCLSLISTWTLESEYSEFCDISKELKPRHKENRFLLRFMYSDLTKSAKQICNKALSAWFNVSEKLVSDVRGVLNAICDNPDIAARPYIENGTQRYHYYRGHPMNRFPDSVRERIEAHLDIIIRADPAGGNGSSVCRVYSPSVNTQEKLRQVLCKELSMDLPCLSECEEDFELSSSTVQRMISKYLSERNYNKISFTQSDHNACPNCKSLQYSILQYYYEGNIAEAELKSLSGVNSEPRRKELQKLIQTKRFQEQECVAEMERHNSRDKRIRETVKALCDYFRKTEMQYAQSKDTVRKETGWDWNHSLDRGRVTHQDDMTKLDLPYFSVTASSDITRFRFDVNAHVNAVTNDAVVFSHEQGMGAKNASLIVEEVLLEHVLRCSGEAFKVIVSDNASVGKNWVTTIALPQYIVDQGLAEVAMVIYLENNHGKWLADMLFGQF